VPIVQLTHDQGFSCLEPLVLGGPATPLPRLLGIDRLHEPLRCACRRLQRCSDLRRFLEQACKVLLVLAAWLRLLVLCAGLLRLILVLRLVRLLVDV